MPPIDLSSLRKQEVHVSQASNPLLLSDATDHGELPSQSELQKIRSAGGFSSTETLPPNSWSRGSLNANWTLIDGRSFSCDSEKDALEKLGLTSFDEVLSSVPILEHDIDRLREFNLHKHR